MNTDKIADAIEKDAGQEIPGLKESLEEMKNNETAREYTADQLTVITARKKTKLSQPMFAELIQTPVGTLRDWEQGRYPVPGSVITLMKIIINNPNILKEIAA